MPYFKRLKELRDEFGFSQEDIADKCNRSRHTYRKWENGQVNISTEDLILIADIYGVSVDYIVERTDVKEINQNKKK